MSGSSASCFPILSLIYICKDTTDSFKKKFFEFYSKNSSVPQPVFDRLAYIAAFHMCSSYGQTTSSRAGSSFLLKEARVSKKKEGVMVIHYFVNDLVDDYAVCPECGCDLVLREEDGLIFVSCVDCSFCEC